MAGDFNTRLVPIRDTLHAPIIFFELHPCQDMEEGIVSITLGASCPQIGAPPRLRERLPSRLYLKCSVQAAVNLRDAINNALSRVPPPPNSHRPSNNKGQEELQPGQRRSDASTHFSQCNKANFPPRCTE